MIKKLKIIAPLFVNIIHKDEWINAFNLTFDELLALNKQISFEIDDKKYLVGIEEIEDAKIIELYKSTNKLIMERIISLEVEIDYDKVNIKESIDNMEENHGLTTYDLLDSYLTDILEKRFYDLIITVNIASPGAIEVSKGNVYIENIIYKKTEGIVSTLKGVYDFSVKYKWPTLKKLEIKKTWNWITNQDGFMNGLGGTSLDRALSAFSYVFYFDYNEENIDLDLFWTMIGLEALYANNGIGINEKIVQKSQALLGVQHEYKKIFKGMYDTRSRFIHGDMNFPGKFHIFDATESFDKFFNNVSESSFMAKSVLVATFQEMVSKQINEINFKYKLLEK